MKNVFHLFVAGALLSAWWATTGGVQTPAANAQAAVAASVTVATVEWIEQFDPGVLASGPGMNYKGSMFDNVVGAAAGGTLSKITGVVGRSWHWCCGRASRALFAAKC